MTNGLFLFGSFWVFLVFGDLDGGGRVQVLCCLVGVVLNKPRRGEEGWLFMGVYSIPTEVPISASLRTNRPAGKGRRIGRRAEAWDDSRPASPRYLQTATTSCLDTETDAS